MDISTFLLVRLLGQCLSNGRYDVLVGVPYASSYEFTEFLLWYVFKNKIDSPLLLERFLSGNDY